MKSIPYVLAVVLAVCAPGYAQTDVTGTWRVDGPSAQTLVFKLDGRTLIGTVRSGVILQISETKISDGNSITFSVKIPSVMSGVDRTLAFTGTVHGDELAVTCEVRVRDGAPRNAVIDGLFPRRFIARRVLDSELSAADTEQIEYTNQVRGMEFAAAVDLIQKDLKVEGRLFLPGKVVRARAIIVVMRWGNGSLVYDDPRWRRLAETLDVCLLRADFSTMSTPINFMPGRAEVGGADGLSLLVQRLAQESRHQELTTAPLLFWGHSAAGGWGATFATLYPQRTIAAVFYQSGAGGADMKAMSHIPALIVKDGGPVTVGPLGAGVDPQVLWTNGRILGAPWTLVLQRNAPHGSPEHLKKADDVMIPWVTAVLHQRLSLTRDSTLASITNAGGWLGNNQTGEVAPHRTFSGAELSATWLPDEITAHAWQAAMKPAK
jgi:hypothetical protein